VPFVNGPWKSSLSAYTIGPDSALEEDYPWCKFQKVRTKTAHLRNWLATTMIKKEK
jgi:hypothetical protein